jgi:hypothetical protein
MRSATGGIITGFVLIAVAIGLLFWNEGRAVNTARALSEGAGQIITIDPSAPPPDAQGKLVHFSGDLVVDGKPADDLFTAISVPGNANRLVRTVEMYQWREEKSTETRKKLGGGEEKVTTFTYKRDWSSTPIDSSRFEDPSGHDNPPMPAKSASFSATQGHVGAIALPGARIAGLGERQQIPLGESGRKAVLGALGISGPATASTGEVYIGANPASPMTGDLRISFSVNTASRISAVGKLSGNTLEPFAASNGVEISMTRAGDMSAAEMFEAAQSTNAMITWALRAAGLLAMYVGFRMIFSIIGVIGDVVPAIGNLLRFATGLVALALTAILGGLVIGVAWLWFRPLLALAIIAAGAVLAFVLLGAGKRKAASRAKPEFGIERPA